MTAYPYATRDLLTDPPEHYHYSAFGGLPFLDGYLSARREALERCDDLADRETGSPEEIELAGRLFVERRPVASPVSPCLPGSAAKVATEGILRACVRARLDGEKHAWQAWTEILLAKFEFAKRLRSAYDADLKPVGAGRIDIGGYCLLAWLLSERADGPMDLRHLNALLKANDIVASAPLRGTGILAVMTARQAIGREVSLVTALAGSKGLSLGPPEDGR